MHSQYGQHVCVHISFFPPKKLNKNCESGQQSKTACLYIYESNIKSSPFSLLPSLFSLLSSLFYESYLFCVFCLANCSLIIHYCVCVCTPHSQLVIDSQISFATLLTHAGHNLLTQFSTITTYQSFVPIPCLLGFYFPSL